MHGRLARVVVGAVLALLALLSASSSQAATLPAGFAEKTVFSGLTQPTAVRFSPDGRVFVAEKSGLIKEFDSLTDTTPRVYADLRTKVHDYWDRGLLGIALDPSFPTKNVIYALYTHDAPDRRHCARLQRHLRRPHRGGLQGQRAALAHPGRRLGAGDDRGLVPAVPEPLDRLAGVRARRPALRERRRRRELQLGRLRPGRRRRSTAASTRPTRAARSAARTCART